MDPRADHAAARAAGLGGWLDAHDRIALLLDDFEHAVSVEPEQAPDIV